MTCNAVKFSGLLPAVFFLISLSVLSSPAWAGDFPSGETAVDILDKTPGAVSGPPAPSPQFPRDYRSIGSIEGRTILWVAIEQHFLLGSLLLGGPLISFLLELFGQLRPRLSGRERYLRLARDVLHFILPFYLFTVLSGVILLAAFLFLYPVFFGYMLTLFRPIVVLYAVAFFMESVLIAGYHFGWEKLCRTEGGRWLHLSLGALLNTNGILIIFWANSLMAFMMSPGGVDEKGRFLGNIWKVIHTPIWHPLNVHRVLASIMFGGVVVGALAAYRFLRSRSEAERAYYDWVGSVMCSIVVITISLLPFAGYWFAQVIFTYRQRMGVTLMGGELSWLFVVQGMLIGAIFIVIAHYLWQGMARMAGSERYYPSIKYLLLTLVICFLVWSTPHTLSGTPQEFKAMGATQHPVVGNYGIMAAKNTAINTILLTIGVCLVIYRRCNKAMTVSWVRSGNILLIALFAVAEANIIFLGIYGFYVPARVRVALALPQFITALTTPFAAYWINGLMLRKARSLGPIRWGQLPKPGAYALFALALLITVTMILMGYIRSSVRLDWHINEIMQDASPWSVTPPIRRAMGIILVNLGVFWGLVIAVLSLSQRKEIRVLRPAVDAEEEAAFAEPGMVSSKRSLDLVSSKTSGTES